MITKKDIVEEIRQELSDSKSLDEILKDLEYEVNLSKWAYRFSTQEFEKKQNLSRKLFHYVLSNAQDYRDYVDFAYYISKKDGLADDDLSKEAYKLAISKITLFRDLRSIADILAKPKDSFYDENMAKSVYKEAIEKASSAYEYLTLAESLCDKSLLNDKQWAKEVYKLALKIASTSDEYEAIAESILNEDNLDDEKWANEVFSISSKLEDN
ncbi:hypothetical protein CP960_02155 [Malaciobacter halophilus]|uniref:Uncharacterized protein n=1 Tax=Malaciobacter halophilus TaxID=197482 RepID=A0A2N1J5S9_9BACT|nr:hypothetical protein [Malaciobacter halophilus]AXH09291.1 hypothetical protein AHALO_0906 [Malaciobacter halophilus]PKI81925.1 hypothetical protein CP960_02155 [Malaciobacter halophilus]